MSALPFGSTIWNIINWILGRSDKESERRAEIKKSLYPRARKEDFTKRGETYDIIFDTVNESVFR